MIVKKENIHNFSQGEGLYIKKLIFLCVIFFTLFADEKTEGEKEQLKEGNLALPESQQPGPLVGFGQNIVEKHDFLVFMFPDSLIGRRKSFTEVAPSILYGIRDNLSIFIEWPIAIDFRMKNQHSSGIQDLLVQLEYAPYNREGKTSTKQITTVTSLILPFGSDRKIPPTGFGSIAFFLGTTASYTGIDWFFYMSPAVLLPTKNKHHTKFGNMLLYQAGIGKNIAYSSNEWIFMWMVEFSGLLRQRDKINGVIDPNSGGNGILICPSLWFSTQHFIGQGTVAVNVYQHLFGNQTKDKIFIAFNLGWKF